MPAFPKSAVLAALLATVLALEAHAQKSTVCTVTVNSADERDAFRQSLPEDTFEFVELVEGGRPDWLASSCRKKVRCDVLVISGHFAGSEFYTSNFDRIESLPVDEMERVACGDSCPDLFSQLKEVYLFGCDTLKPEPVKSATPEIVRSLLRSGFSKPAAESIANALSQRHGESSRDRMRRIFPNVPVIYGFAALAPYGRVAGPMLRSYFQSGPDEEIGSGRVSQKLLALFGPASMVATTGLRETDPEASYRPEACRFHDDRLSLAQKLGSIHRTMGGEVTDVRMSFDRVEKFFASLGDDRRREAGFSRALAEMSGDRATRDRYLAITRDTEDPALRIRMITLARTVGWLSAAEQKAELVHMIGDMLAAGSMDFGDVDLICTLNKDHELDASIRRVKASPSPAGQSAHAAALACLGSTRDHARILRALASPREQDVQVAQAYLRHRPITDRNELRAVAAAIVRMTATGAQVRALDTLGRHRINDREILDGLTRLFARTANLGVQRAIAEIFIRSDAREVATRELVSVLRQHRVNSPEGEDVIDVLINRLRDS